MAFTRLSATCQQIISEDLNSISSSTIIIRSCMADPDLSPIITNHKCNDVVLTPSGLYADMAVEVAKHIWQHHRGRGAELPGINVCDLEVHKPLLVKDVNRMDQLWLEMTAAVELPPNSRQDIVEASVDCVFHSITPEGTRLQENGRCTVRFEWYYGWLSEWSNQTSTIQSRIDKLYARATKEIDEQVRFVQRNTAYKLFESFVQYSGKYQNMSEVVFDSETLEATSLLSFLPDAEMECTGPYYLDGSCHLSGFVCNAVEKDKDNNAFISNGVSAMKLSPKFEPAKKASEIRNYVRMQQLPNDKTVLQGDVYILQDGEIVGVWESVRFKKIPRKVLNVFLPPPKR